MFGISTRICVAIFRHADHVISQTAAIGLCALLSRHVPIYWGSWLKAGPALQDQGQDLTMKPPSERTSSLQLFPSRRSSHEASFNWALVY